MDPLVMLRNASKIYTQADVKTPGITNVSFEVAQGDFIAITGRSGCGKSTLLNILGMMDCLTEGQYLFCGENVTNLKGKYSALFRNRQIFSRKTCLLLNILLSVIRINFVL